MVGPKGCAVGSILNGNGLYGDTDDVDAIRVCEQRGRSWIHVYTTIAVIVNIHHDHVIPLVDESGYHQSATASGGGGGHDCHRWRRVKQFGVNCLAAWGGASSWNEEILKAKSLSCSTPNFLTLSWRQTRLHIRLKSQQFSVSFLYILISISFHFISFSFLAN